VKKILERVKKEEVLKLYQLSDFITFKEFLIKLAQKLGKYKSGGKLDLDTTAKILV